jgi:hypothetical protein
MLLVRLVVVGAIIVKVTLIALLLLDTLPISALVFNPAACIPIADDVMQVMVVPMMPFTTLLRWRCYWLSPHGDYVGGHLRDPVFVLLVMD